MTDLLATATLDEIKWNFFPCPHCFDGKASRLHRGDCRTCRGFAQIRTRADFTPPMRSTRKGEGGKRIRARRQTI